MIDARLQLILLIFLCCPAFADSRQHRMVIGTRIHQGIEVELAVEPVGHGSTLDLRAGKTVRFLFSIRDTTSGKPITGLFPAAWMQTRPEKVTKQPNAKKMVEAFVGGGLFAQPDIDLNVYHVLTLNQDSTISVVDPLFGFGGSKLLTMISLPGPGRDWAKMTRASKLFVSLPDSNQIALIDTSSWSISTLMPQVNQPTRLFLQPDEHFLWASIPGGVGVFKTAPFSFQHLIPTGEGEHAITFSPDNRFAYITNSGDGTLSIVDLANFKVSKTIQIGRGPTTIAYDFLSESIYITNSKSGVISCIDGQEHELYKTIKSESGLGQIRFAPKGRWGFIVNPKTNRLSILDSSLDRIVQTGIIGEAPSEISFSDNFAYIRHLQSPTLFMVPLDGKELGTEGRSIPVVETPGGDSAYGDPPPPALSIVQAPGANAVLIANPKDKAIYFYKEGMGAPMGHFNNYGREPRSVLVIDRSLRERSRSGVYETVAKLEKSGISDLVFFTDSPRMSLGFELKIGDDSGLADKDRFISLTVAPSSSPATFTAGQSAKFTFQVSPITDHLPSQLHACTFMVTGGWRDRQAVKISADGSITASITPPIPGVYQTIFESDSSHLKIQQTKKFIFQVSPKN
jgi:YVTN family beta-propeller protein